MMLRSALAAALFLVVISVDVEAKAPAGTCTRTARVARDACGNDVRDNFLITQGRCLNTSNAGDRAECLDNARQTRADDLELCIDQFDARIDVCEEVGEAPYDPAGFVPSNFVDPLQIGDSVAPNPFFPLVPGARWVYQGGGETNIVKVVGEVAHILGVPCTVVHDVVKVKGTKIEDTIDWFAQHVDGSVWYCGESVQNFDEGDLVDLEGSWKAGRDLARPGVIMPATPVVGAVYRQEFLLGDAEDIAEVLTLSGSETVAATSCAGNCLITKDTTPLEPDVVEQKSLQAEHRAHARNQPRDRRSHGVGGVRYSLSYRLGRKLCANT